MKIETLNKLCNLTNQSADALSQCRFHLLQSRRPLISEYDAGCCKEKAEANWETYTELQIEIAKIQFAKLAEDFIEEFEEVRIPF